MKKVTHECLVCNTALEGLWGKVFSVFGIKRSIRNPNICNRCDAHMQEGRVVELSIIFADLTGFTEMTNHLGAERSYEVVGAFFKMANQEIIRNDGCIDKYIGDAVMAIFNAPIQNTNHMRAATTAALGIQAGMQSVSEEMGLNLQARVGVATGFARVGQLGSADRRDYTAIGDVVNLASRLETFANPGEVIVDGKAFVQVAEDYPDLIPEVINVRGFAEAVEIYRIGKAQRKSVKASRYAGIDTHDARQKMGLGTILFTIFGVPCATATTLSPLAVILGAGSLMSALSPVLNALDVAQIRIPLQLFAVLGASINLYVIWLARSHRKQAAADLTLFEKRKTLLLSGFSMLALLAVAYETYVHIFVLGMSYLAPSL